MAVRAGLALGCSIRARSRFARQIRLSLNGDGCSKNDPRQPQCLMDAADLAVRNAADLSLSAWLGLGLRL